MAEDNNAPASSDSSGGERRKRRRRRRRSGSGGSSGGGSRREAPTTTTSEIGERTQYGRRQMVEVTRTVATTPASGRNPHKKRSSRPRRSAPKSTHTRRRRVKRGEVQSLSDWLDALPDTLLANLYKGVGGQPRRVSGRERMVQLTARAIAQGNRLGSLLGNLHERDRKALAALLQSGGIAHAEEFHRDLTLTYGGHEREWKRSMVTIANQGIVFASPVQDGEFFYIVPDPLMDPLTEQLKEDISLPVFDSAEITPIDTRPFVPPLDFSITSLATYIGQNNIRLTQRHDVYRQHKEALDEFFAQVWSPDSELFDFHLDFLMMHGMVELRGDYLNLNREVMEEFLQLEPEDQRDLIFSALDRRFDMAEWVLWAIFQTDAEWIAERPLVSLYRHWKRGDDWQHRFQSGSYAKHRTNERDSFTFSPLVQTGLLDMGKWGQEKFYRLTERARALLSPSADDGFRQFYLTPDFKMMAPAGLAPILLYRMGELAELTGCDRANTYKITEVSVESAVENGWRRDDVLQFLRDNSQLGLPENVEETLKGWIGHRGDVEFHDLMVVTVHRSQIRRFEGNKRVKPYILHRFAPGLYAVDRSKLSEISDVFTDCGFSPAREVRSYPGTADVVEARASLVKLLADAREQNSDPMKRAGDVVDPSQLLPVPGSRSVKRKGRDTTPEPPPTVTPPMVRQIVEGALIDGSVLEMVYVAKNGQRLTLDVEPERFAVKAQENSTVLIGLDIAEDTRRTFVLDRIERLRVKES